MDINFYNTGGAYYSADNSRVVAEQHYYASKNRKWIMNITAAQMALIPSGSEIEQVTVRMYNQSNWNSTFSFYAVASKETSVGTAFVEGNYFGKTATQSCVLHPTWSEYFFDVTSCFQYAQTNWPRQAWNLWFYWTAGSSEGTPLIGYNNTTYANWRCPYFTITTKGGPTAATAYVWSTTRHEVEYPAAAMTSTSSQSCVASASSTYSSSYPVWRCFDNSTSSAAWASSASATGPWVKLKCPNKIYSVTVDIINRGDRSDNIRGPIDGVIEGSNDDSTWTEIGSFSGRDGATMKAQTTHTCTNHTVGYQYIRVRMTDWYPSGSHTYCAIGEINIRGYDMSTNGGWVQATPYLANSSGVYTAVSGTYIMEEA